jgi:hypothetical protein
MYSEKKAEEIEKLGEYSYFHSQKRNSLTGNH